MPKQRAMEAQAWQTEGLLTGGFCRLLWPRAKDAGPNADVRAPHQDGCLKIPDIPMLSSSESSGTCRAAATCWRHFLRHSMFSGLQV
eukprot:CAMPEP_0174358862 /NCGR_PEP_ID=MMETSP0811_2-20130205/45032_1 /TAXON_ID=73025 ORGANISM="Eutreptiella gymnastica-like, Strain CCMP1594" /NCGR_SAMPLE_ID=MMETSP0811_2 /ASSEMBLY_ACC=CAM_ASM_000667 /LENGTH=86 /DNA_ID=CAMNT_0015492997 /DNA_START=175 /DNA_END=436 /DNA_ORIENTATION=-